MEISKLCGTLWDKYSDVSSEGSDYESKRSSSALDFDDEGSNLAVGVPLYIRVSKQDSIIKLFFLISFKTILLWSSVDKTYLENNQSLEFDLKYNSSQTLQWKYFWQCNFPLLHCQLKRIMKWEKKYWEKTCFNP